MECTEGVPKPGWDLYRGGEVALLLSRRASGERAIRRSAASAGDLQGSGGNAAAPRSCSGRSAGAPPTLRARRTPPMPGPAVTSLQRAFERTAAIPSVSSAIMRPFPSSTFHAPIPRQLFAAPVRASSEMSSIMAGETSP